MKDYRLSAQETPRATRHIRAAYRPNGVILLGSGWSSPAVADALLIERNGQPAYAVVPYAEFEHLCRLAEEAEVQVIMSVPGRESFARQPHDRDPLPSARTPNRRRHSRVVQPHPTP